MLLLAFNLVSPIAHAADAEHALPALGDAGGGVISPQGERRLGAAFMRMLRGSTNLYYDPLVNEYVENLAWRLASHSDIAEPRLDLVLINDSEINAFAAPGGVMGVNAGLLLATDREDEVAGVLSHELAHLSQRHFARGLDQQRQQQPLSLAALLASILIGITAGSDAAAAAMMSTQAGLIQRQLAFSRDNEREADRIGMQTLANAGFDPDAVPAFFEKLQRAVPIDSDRYPEFLLTHPITDTRISDSRNRAQQLHIASDVPRNNRDFLMARVRLQVSFARDPSTQAALFSDALKQIEANPKSNPDLRDSLRYGLSLSQMRAGRYDDALANISLLRKNAPERIAWHVGEGDILLASGRTKEAADSLTDALALAPDNFPLSMLAAQALLRDNRAARANALMERQAVLRPTDANVWQLLARTRAAANDNVGVFAARAEALYLKNQYDAAHEQLDLGVKAAGNDFARAAPLRNRMKEIEQTRDDFKL